jgi:molybdopterin-guanine dinucleotide biosynthesis protein
MTTHQSPEALKVPPLDCTLAEGFGRPPINKIAHLRRPSTHADATKNEKTPTIQSKHQAESPHPIKLHTGNLT